MIFRKNDLDSVLDQSIYNKAKKRARKLEHNEALNWMDTAGTEMAWYVNRYRKSGNTFDLREIKEAATKLLALVNELEERHSG